MSSIIMEAANATRLVFAAVGGGHSNTFAVSPSSLSLAAGAVALIVTHSEAAITNEISHDAQLVAFIARQIRTARADTVVA